MTRNAVYSPRLFSYTTPAVSRAKKLALLLKDRIFLFRNESLYVFKRRDLDTLVHDAVLGVNLARRGDLVALDRLSPSSQILTGRTLHGDELTMSRMICSRAESLVAAMFWPALAVPSDVIRLVKLQI